MLPPLTDAQRARLDSARGLAARFAERAEQHDREGSFPFENFDDLRRRRLPGPGAAARPRRRAACRSTSSACCRKRSARGCGATALGTNMHWYNLGGGLHLFTEPFRRRVADAVVRDGAIVASSISEPGAEPRRAAGDGAQGRRRLSRHAAANTSARWRRSCASSSSTPGSRDSIGPACPARSRWRPSAAATGMADHRDLGRHGHARQRQPRHRVPRRLHSRRVPDRRRGRRHRGRPRLPAVVRARHRRRSTPASPAPRSTSPSTIAKRRTLHPLPASIAHLPGHPVHRRRDADPARARRGR